MVQLRSNYLVIAATPFLGAHSMNISNQTSTPTVSLDSGKSMTAPHTTVPHKPRAILNKYTARVVYKNPNLYPRDSSPTPAPTGPSKTSTTVHVADTSNFAILLPRQGSNSSIGDSEVDAQAYCFGSTGCNGQPMLAQGFIAAANVQTGGSGGDKYIQVTGCINPSVMGLSTSDQGGQYDVRFPNGAQCTFGGYGASFIEQVEPANRRFCLRCCSLANDQSNCNSHNDQAGCTIAIPGKYDFPEKGISCA